MKKVLLATTALALSAGVASAEVALSGSARMGLVSVDGETALDNRMTINIDASTETTSGLTFGARLRIRSNDGAAVTSLSNGDEADLAADGPDAGVLDDVVNADDNSITSSVNGARVYMKSGAVEVAVGNIYGAIDSMPGLYQSEAGLVGNGAGDVGSIAAGYDSYASTGGYMGIEAIYSAGAFTGHLSVTDESIGSATNRVAVHGAYTMNDWTVALGMQDSDDDVEDLTAATVSGKIGDYGVGLSGMRADGESKITLNGSATFGATSVSAFVSNNTTADTSNAYGIGLAYDLGGASLVGAVERQENGTTYADMGVSFSF